VFFSGLRPCGGRGEGTGQTREIKLQGFYFNLPGHGLEHMKVTGIE
jgi:hypothetical protein